MKIRVIPEENVSKVTNVVKAVLRQQEGDGYDSAIANVDSQHITITANCKGIFLVEEFEVEVDENWEVTSVEKVS